MILANKAEQASLCFNSIKSKDLDWLKGFRARKNAI